jgi:hypothetical protein
MLLQEYSETSWITQFRKKNKQAMLVYFLVKIIENLLSFIEVTKFKLILLASCSIISIPTPLVNSGFGVMLLILIDRLSIVVDAVELGVE